MCRRDTTRPETASTTIRTNGIHSFFSRATHRNLSFTSVTVTPSRRRIFWRTVGIRDEPTQDGNATCAESHSAHCSSGRQGRQQRAQAFPAEPPAVVEQRLAVRR